MVIIEPLGAGEGKLLAMAGETLGDRVEIMYYNTKTMDTAELIGRGKGAEIIVVSNLLLNAQVIKGCRNLKLLAVAFIGADRIAMDVCRKDGVMVYDCAGYSTCAVTDLVSGILTSLYRNVIPCDKVHREEGTKDDLVGFELKGKTFGVVGTGAVGLRVTTMVQAFGYRVLVYNRATRDVPGVRYVDLETLLAECDAVSLHIPLTEETKGLMSEEHIELMKKDTVLINTTRGPVADNDALTKAPKEGRIAGACIDVFENEPSVRKDHPLLSASNIIVTPHVAFAIREALVKRTVTTSGNVINHLDGTSGNMIG